MQIADVLRPSARCTVVSPAIDEQAREPVGACAEILAESKRFDAWSGTQKGPATMPAVNAPR